MNASSEQSPSYQVVGHRGFPEKYPENSLVGLVAAAKLESHCVELDVQMSKDGVPMVFHDATLNRVCDAQGNIWDFTAKKLIEISNHEPVRFGETFRKCSTISTLRAVAEALSALDSFVFVEIKKESMAKFSRENILISVLGAIEPIKDKCSIISFDYDFLQITKQEHAHIGWVLSDMQQSTLLRAQMLKPQVLAYNVKKLSKNDVLWPGEWDWFLWDIVDPSVALEWAENGVKFIETWNPEKLMKSL